MDMAHLKIGYLGGRTAVFPSAGTVRGADGAGRGVTSRERPGGRCKGGRGEEGEGKGTEERESGGMTA